MNRFNEKIKTIISNQISPETLEIVSDYTKNTRRYNSLGNSTLKVTGTATRVLENGAWVLKPAGRVAEFVNKPFNATYNNLVKPFYRDEGVEICLGEEKSQSSLLTALDYTGKAAGFSSDKKLTEKIEKITNILEKLDKYTNKIEWWTNHLRDLQQQESRQIEFAQLNNNADIVKKVMSELDKKGFDEQNIDKFLGINEWEDLETKSDIKSDYEIIPSYQEEQERLASQQFLSQQPLPGAWEGSLEDSLKEALGEELDTTIAEPEIDEDEDWLGKDWKTLEWEFYDWQESKIWQLLRKTNNTVIGLNQKVKEYSELAEMVRQLLVEIESIQVTGWKKTDEWMLQNVVAPIVKRLGNRGKNIGELIEKGWLAEDARWLAGFVEKYNGKVKSASEYVEWGTSYLSEKIIKKQDNKRHYQEFVHLNDTPYRHRNKEDIEVFEDELEVAEKTKAEVVQQPLKGWFGGLLNKFNKKN